jgi:tetratricopeptide (TPR) repeat protein
VLLTLAVCGAARAVEKAEVQALALDRARRAELSALASKLFAEGDLHGAEQVLLEIADLPGLSRGERSEALVNVAWLRYQRGRSDLAKPALERVFLSDPELELDLGLYDSDFGALVGEGRRDAEARRERDPSLLLGAARAARTAGRTERSAELLARGLALSPGGELEAHLLYELGALDRSAGRSRDAIERLRACLRVDGLPSDLRAAALAELAAALFEVGDLAASEESWSLAARQRPDDPLVWRNLGFVRRSLGDLEGSVVALRSAQRLEPAHVDTVAALARGLVDLGAGKDAITLLESALVRRGSEPDLWQILGRAALEAGDLERARHALVRTVETDPANDGGLGALAAGRLAHLALEAGKHEDALEWAQVAVQLDPRRAEYWRFLATSLRLSARYEEALAALDKASGLGPPDAGLIAEKGLILIETGRSAEARRAFQDALRIDPNQSASRQALARLDATLRPGSAPPRGKPSDAAARSLGLSVAELDYSRLGLRGALVGAIDPRGAAARAGLREGDLIVKLGSREVVDGLSFHQILASSRSRRVLEVELLRDAEIRRHRLPLR